MLLVKNMNNFPYIICEKETYFFIHCCKQTKKILWDKIARKYRKPFGLFCPLACFYDESFHP